MTPLPHRSIVLVEDDPDMVLLMRLCLRPDPRLRIRGHATSCRQAIALAEALDPDLVVLDQSLEGETDGLATAPLLKRGAVGSKVLLCGTLELAEAARAEPTVDAFLRKDRLRDLLPTVQRLLGLDELTEA